jgi:DNA-binding NarL/FixJ family response regulator
MTNSLSPEIIPTPPRRIAPPVQSPAVERCDVGALKTITILIADDHAPFRKVLRSLLEKEDQFELVGQVKNGQEAVKIARKLRPDVILMDLSMPVLSGLEATRQIMGFNPAAKVLFLSGYDDDQYVAQAVSVGALGFLSKTTDSRFLIEAIREVAKGNWFFSPAIAARMANKKK